jgi:uncharacterized membrane protein (DUF4010 family)
MAKRHALCHWQAMQRRFPSAGGFFLIVAILAGFVIGAMRGDVVEWTLIGTLAGIALAVLVWLKDRRPD